MTKNSKPLCVSFFLIAVCIIFSLNSGCKPSEKRIKEQQAASEQIAENTFDKIAKLESEQKFAEAEKLVTSAMQDNSLAAHRDRLLSRKSELLTRQDKTSETEDLIISYLKKEPAITQNALNDLFHYYYNNKMFEKSIAFSDRILISETKLPDSILTSILSQRLAAAIGTEDLEGRKIGSGYAHENHQRQLYCNQAY